MTLQPINSLPTASPAQQSDITVLIQGGIYKKVTLSGLVNAFPDATIITKGLMSAIDKQTLNLTVEQISNLVAPVSTPVASASIIAVPSGRYFITLSGTNEITGITGLVPRVKYVFSYPTGVGLTFLGEPMLAGDLVEVIDV